MNLVENVAHITMRAIYYDQMSSITLASMSNLVNKTTPALLQNSGAVARMTHTEMHKLSQRCRT
jgi:hypothetical protein